MLAAITENKNIVSSYYKMGLSYKKNLNASPGQFVMIRVNNSYDPFLRRPMSIYRIDKNKGKFEILYQVAGKGTNIMAGLKKGDEVDVLGPLGTGFSIPKKFEHAIIIAGGIGVAPMAALSEKLRITNYELRITVFIGGKTKDDILCKEDFKKIGAKVHIATEDGSMGKKGTCVDLVRSLEFGVRSSKFKNPQSAIRNPQSVIFACGPQGMLKAVAEIAKDKNMPCQVSLDKRMACGTGACLGCVVKVRSSEFGVRSLNSQFAIRNSQLYKCVCTDGPVFNAEEINWEEI